MSSEHDNAQHDAVFVRNFALVLGGLTAIFVIIIVLARVVTGVFGPAPDSYAESMDERLAPVGQLNTTGKPITLAGSAPSAGTAPSATPVAKSPGEATYNQVCFACHAQGIAGAPKFGDAAAWAPRIAQGIAVLHKHALEGYNGKAGMMPARGGSPTLSDDAIKAGVNYMVQAAQGKKIIEANDPVTPPASSSAPATAPAVADAGKGKADYDAVCFVCHTPGAAGAPKFGDAAAWAPRIAKGLDVLHEHALNGFMGQVGLMPPKGGRPDMADADIKAAVDYMTSNSK